jgi:hypothetical protein
MNLAPLGPEFQAPSFRQGVEYGLCTDETGKLWLCVRDTGCEWRAIAQATQVMIDAFGYCQANPGDPWEKATAPGYWMNETTVLRPSVYAYLTGQPLDPAAISAIRAYLRQWINAPAWLGGEAIDQLRGMIDSLTSRAAIDAWVTLALSVDIDPF